MRSGAERKARAARGAGTPDLSITKRALYQFHHHGAVRRLSDFGVSAGWATLPYCRLHRGTVVSAGCHCFARASKAGHGSVEVHRAGHGAAAHHVCESGLRRGRDPAGVRVLNKPSGGIRLVQHTTVCEGISGLQTFCGRSRVAWALRNYALLVTPGRVMPLDSSRLQTSE